jgi:hypothetical protein
MPLCLNCGTDNELKKYCNLQCSRRFRSRIKPTVQKYKKEACEFCASTKELHVHHQDQNPANNEPSNLVTLCKTHHQILHSRGKLLKWIKPGRHVNIRIQTPTYHQLAGLRDKLKLKSIDELIERLLNIPNL